MRAAELSHPTVREVITALRHGDREAFYAAFADDVHVISEGRQRDLYCWAESEIFPEHGRVCVRSQSPDGQEVVGSYHSDRRNLPDTAWHFDVVDGLIRYLDIDGAEGA